MKNSIILSSIFALVFSYVFAVAPTTASAACSINGYIHSGGKCGQSWEKKEKHDDDDDEDEDEDEEDDD